MSASESETASALARLLVEACGLAEYGLEPKLAAPAQRSPLELRVAALPDRRLPEVMEVTVYYVVSEALSNAVKYPRPRSPIDRTSV